MVLEILLGDRLVSRQTITQDKNAAGDLRLMKRPVLQAALSAGQLQPSEAFRVTFRTLEAEDGEPRTAKMRVL